MKKLVPKIVKHYFRFYTSKLLNIPYNRHGVPNEIVEWLPLNSKITVVDIGASEGNFFMPLTKSYSINAAVLIEPLPNRVVELKEKYKDKYIIVNRAVSDTVGQSEFFISEEFDYASSLLKFNAEVLQNMQLSQPKKVIIETDTLDHIILEANIGNIDLIKIDVQGVEHSVIKSGTETLAKTKLIYVEVSYKMLYQNSSTFFEIYQLLTEQNFRMVNVSEGYKSANGELLQSDVLFANNKPFNTI